MRNLLIMLAAMAMLAASANAVSAQGPFGPRGPGGHGGRPSFDRLLEAFDDNDDKSLEQDEVPGRVWWRLSQADADDDGYVTRKEFDSYRP